MLDGIIVSVLLLGAVFYLTRRFYRIYHGQESCACGGKCHAGGCGCGCGCSAGGACHCSACPAAAETRVETVETNGSETE